MALDKLMYKQMCEMCRDNVGNDCGLNRKGNNISGYLLK